MPSHLQGQEGPYGRSSSKADTEEQIGFKMAEGFREAELRFIEASGG